MQVAVNALDPSDTSLTALRLEGAQHLDPVRFHYMEVLSARLSNQQHGAVRRILEAKLQQALSDYVHRLKQAPGLRQGDSKATSAPGQASLVELNCYIKNSNISSIDEGQFHHLSGKSELKSVRHFRQAWSKIHAQDQVVQALGRGPDNAGPLNSHRLVLRSLSLMNQLSPDYLQRFLSHVDALLWLDRTSLKQVTAEAKPVRRGRLKK